MKKLLVALVALTTVSAFADGHSMVKLDGCFDGRCDTLDFNMASDDDGNSTNSAEEKSQTIALNYAMAFGGNFGAGLTYVSRSATADGDIAAVSDAEDAIKNSNTIGLSFYWNKDGSFTDSCFAALHHNTTTTKEDDVTPAADESTTTTEIVLEYGHRYGFGKVMGVTMNWVPSVSYTMGTVAYDNGDDDKTTSLQLNVANFAATF